MTSELPAVDRRLGMGQNTAGHRPSYASGNRDDLQDEGFVVSLITTSDRWEVEWYHGTAQQAVAAARRQFHGCTIEEVYGLSLVDWISSLRDIERMR